MNKGVKNKSKPLTENTFLKIVRRLLRIWLYCFKKLFICDLKTLSSQNLTKSVKKAQNFPTIQEPLKKTNNIAHEQVMETIKVQKRGSFSYLYCRLATVGWLVFLGVTSYNYFNEFETSVKFCAFWIPPYAKIENDIFCFIAIEYTKELFFESQNAIRRK